MKRPWLKPGVVAAGLVPLALLSIRAVSGGLGANPIATAMNQLGLVALILLLATLACTPIKIVWGATWPIAIRKTLGLLAFAYVTMHFLTYAVVDQGLALSAIVADIAERPFILVGFTAFVLLIPLAVTSTSGMLKRLGAKRWKQLHRLAYLCAGLGVIHFALRVKKDPTEPVIYGAVLATLLLARFLTPRPRASARPQRQN
jgi:methionine sulfoxide reductase heme-binding subunit